MSEVRPLSTFAFRIGYLSDGFDGYARQPGRETVEGTLRAGLRRRGVLDEEGEERFRTASRTDRGVHALGNVVVFPTPLPGRSAARALDSIDPRIFCFGYAEVDPKFNPRHARERWYRYLEPGEGRRLAVWRKGARLFVGEHDLSSFSRRDDPPRPTRGRLNELRVEKEGGYLVLDLRGPSFLWNQVRKTVAALELLDAGRLTFEEVELALEGDKVLQLPLAPPGGLVLMEVAYDLHFEEVTPGAGAQRRRLLEEGLREARTRETLLGWFQARALPGPVGRSEP